MLEEQYARTAVRAGGGFAVRHRCPAVRHAGGAQAALSLLEAHAVRIHVGHTWSNRASPVHPIILISCMLHQPCEGWRGQEGRAGMWSQRSPAELPSIAAAATGRRTGEFSGELPGLVAKKSRGCLAVPAHYERKSIISQACYVSNGALCMPVTPGHAVKTPTTAGHLAAQQTARMLS